MLSCSDVNTMKSAFSVALFAYCIYQTIIFIICFLCICASILSLIVNIAIDSGF